MKLPTHMKLPKDPIGTSHHFANERAYFAPMVLELVNLPGELAKTWAPWEELFNDGPPTRTCGRAAPRVGSRGVDPTGGVLHAVLRCRRAENLAFYIMRLAVDNNIAKRIYSKRLALDDFSLRGLSGDAAPRGPGDEIPGEEAATGVLQPKSV